MAYKLVFFGYDTAGFVQCLTAGIEHRRFVNITFPAIETRTKTFNSFLCRLNNLFSFFYSLLGYRKRFILLGNCGILGNKNYQIEVFLCRMLKHEIIILNQGSQTRLPCINCSGMTPAVLESISTLIIPEPNLLNEYRGRTTSKIYSISKYCGLGATYIDTRQTAYMHREKFLDFEYIKLPWPKEAIYAFAHAKDKHYRDTCIHITHAPSRRLGKGTTFVRSLISRLKSEGLYISYQELYGLSNEAVMEVFANSHIVIDQVFNDVPIARVGLEAISSGCVFVQSSPVVHIDDNHSYFGISTVLPQDLYNYLLSLIQDRVYRLSILEHQYEMIKAHYNFKVFNRLSSPFPSSSFIQPGSCLAVPWEYRQISYQAKNIKIFVINP